MTKKPRKREIFLPGENGGKERAIEVPLWAEENNSTEVQCRRYMKQEVNPLASFVLAGRDWIRDSATRTFFINKERLDTARKQRRYQESRQERERQRIDGMRQQIEAENARFEE